MGGGGGGFLNHFRDKPEGLEGVTCGGSVSGLLQGSRGGKVNGLG